MRSSILKTCFAVLTILLHCSVHLVGQQIPLSEGLLEFNGETKQKIIRLSANIAKSWNQSSDLVYAVYYNASVDRDLPRDQRLKAVHWIYYKRDMRPVFLPLWDDGAHFDRKGGDSIYGNFRILAESELDANELIVQVERDSIGVQKIIDYPPTSIIPPSPAIFFPWIGATITRQPLVIHWKADADGGGVALIEGQFDLRKDPGPILWQVEHRRPIRGILSDTMHVALSPSRTYSIVVWSYIMAQVFSGAWHNESFSVETTWFTIAVPDALSQGMCINSVFPNPVREAAVISWNQPVADNVSLSVCDIIGREVKLLAAETMPAGTNVVIWNVLDSQGHRVPSGVYFISLKSRSAQQTVKLVVVR